LHEHRPQDVEETDAQLAELVAVGLVVVIGTPSGEGDAVSGRLQGDWPVRCQREQKQAHQAVSSHPL
jgi:hypothetical protein